MPDLFPPHWHEDQNVLDAWGDLVTAVTGHRDFDEESADGPQDIYDFAMIVMARDPREF